MTTWPLAYNSFQYYSTLQNLTFTDFFMNDLPLSLELPLISETKETITRHVS